jgi:Na+-driven multidrug efflux pump
MFSEYDDVVGEKLRRILRCAFFTLKLNFAGVAVGCGWQAFVAYVNIACYYGIGIPLGCVLGFHFDLGAMVN